MTLEDSLQVLGSLTLRDFMVTRVELGLSKTLVNQDLGRNIHRMQFTPGIVQSKECISINILIISPKYFIIFLHLEFQE